MADGEDSDGGGESTSPGADLGSGGPRTRQNSGGLRVQGMSEKARGKQRARALSGISAASRGDNEREDETGSREGLGEGSQIHSQPQARGRSVTVIFANEGPEGGKVDVWVEEGESVGMVKDQVCVYYRILLLVILL